MSTAMPQVPPRPVRVQDPALANTSSLAPEMPRIPPRPANRRLDRSQSPHRESYARSPLNEAPGQGNHGKSSLHISGSADSSSSDVPRRPSSIVLPSIGHEGDEYAEIFAAPAELGTSPTQTRNISSDLKIHAPKPSLPTSSAKQRVSTVTRTDSGQAAAFGLGKASVDEKDPSPKPLRTKASFTSQHSASERPPSSLDGEHGIPEIGQRVPMYPNAGDVQAPSPAPFAQPFEKGIGFHNDGSKPRHHGRRASGRGHEIPPDAYGRYGHGVVPHDRFEKAYYEKHPELFKKELGQYGEGRPEWAMSSEDLNKIVRDTASRNTGLGSSTPKAIGTPSEQIGFQASEEYTSRISSPRPLSASYHLAHSNASENSINSPLRKESFPDDMPSKPEFESTLSKGLSMPDHAVDEEDTIHVDTPGRRISKIYGGAGNLDSTEDLGPGGVDDGIHDEHGYGAPILASDEVAKEPFAWELQPAVSPMAEQRGADFYNFKSGSASSLSNSRPSSRPGSIHGTIPGLRLPDTTHLEDLDEYEPLFPEEVKDASGAVKPVTLAAKVKGRPELKNRKFPSQDIWEDSPNSLQYTATVSTPQAPEEDDEDKAIDDDTPEKAFARRQEELAEQEPRNAESFLAKEKKPWSQKSQLVAETRPAIKQRFPSRDIWEDSPDSLQLETTVGGPQGEEETASPADDLPLLAPKPSIPARPAKSKLSEPSETAQPIVPERPIRGRAIPPADSPSPPVPVKTKPQVPARPSKPITRESTESIPLTHATSNTSARSIGSDQGAAAATKPKPPIPARTMGSKIAALQGGFMSDLNKRLQLGPQAPKKEEVVAEEGEPEKEKAPLVDARKGRARGPARRAPAKSPAPAAAEISEKPNSGCALSITTMLWQIDPEEGSLYVPSIEAEKEVPVATKAVESETPTLATNIAGDSLHESSEIAPGAEKAASLPSETEDIHAEEAEDEEKEAVVSHSIGNNHDSEPVKSSDEPHVSSSTLLSPEVEEEDLSASTATLKPKSEVTEVEKAKEEDNDDVVIVEHE